MRNIDRIPGIPSQFDITKYEGAGQFGLSEWAVNLVTRIDRWELANLDCGETCQCIDSDSRRRIHVFLRRDSRQRMHSPLLPVTDEHLDIFRSRPRNAAAELTLLDFADLTTLGYSGFTPDKYEAWKKCPKARDWVEKVRSRCNDVYAVKRADQLSMREAIDETGRYHSATGVVPIMVDVNQPMVHILEDTQCIVENLRAEFGIYDQRKPFDQKSFDRWHQQRVLAYMDLRILARVNGTKLTEHSIGVALFPDEIEINPAERVRRTIRPLAERLLTIQTSVSLAAQIRQASCEQPD
ncbi:DUF6387 family protein [Paraburkholderia caribensis]|uniref:DUF6387 family protein n=1 Tax=Paraburkholderia caribensis TaxID=75105 RepID=UPI001CAB6F60|nr:DUF6387 family protein [Paraburkholderia caribensis]CAG9269355.1 hypothetical protein PCAR4_810066 [Paraburkholderia caribensis]